MQKKNVPKLLASKKKKILNTQKNSCAKLEGIYGTLIEFGKNAVIKAGKLKLKTISTGSNIGPETLEAGSGG